jgi:hypothetical protein
MRTGWTFKALVVEAQSQGRLIMQAIMRKKEVEQPQNPLGARHKEGHGD